MHNIPLTSPEASPSVLGPGTKELVATRWSMPLDDGTHLVVTGHEPGIFRLRVCAEGARENPLVRYGLVAPGLAPATLRISEGVSHTVLRLAGATLRVAHETGAAELFSADGAHLLATSALEDGMDRGYRWSARHAAGDRVYGLGDVTRDRIEKSGYRTGIWVSNVKSYVPVPWVMCARGWGVFVNTSWRHVIDCGARQAQTVLVECGEGPFDVCLIAGAGFRPLLEQFTALTGRPCLLPQWAYGLTFVCNEQANAREVLDDCLAFRNADIPCDLVGLEPGWMSEHYDYSVDKQWHPERFRYPSWLDGRKNPHTFLGAIDRLGFKVSLWLCCDYDLTWEEERQAAERERSRQESAKGNGADHTSCARNARRAGARSEACFHPDDFERDERLGHSAVRADKLTKPEEPWFRHLEKFVDQGVSAFKMDGALQVNEHPDRLYGNGMRDEEAHNLYPSILNKQMALGFRARTGRRAMIYSSGGYIGIQRFAATWAGDTGGGQKPLVSMLNHALCGHANVSCDMEVFSAEGIHFGFLQPWSQVCSWAYWRHPQYLGEELTPVFRFYAKLRYRLQPYIYAAAHEAARTGWPILRPMVLVHPEHPETDACLHQYYLGDSLLVGAFTDRMWLPPGSEWIDYWTGERYPGGDWRRISVPAGRGGPLLVRAGSILPQAPERSHIGTKPAESITWEIFPPSDGQVAKTRLVEDDGETLEHERGAVATIEACCTRVGERLRIEIGAREGRYAGMPARRSHLISIHTEAAPLAAFVDGVPVDVRFDENVSMCLIRIERDEAKASVVNLEFDARSLSGRPD
jgi:Alpha-glucosidases, family 31 of glycosyl hydrolases